ncbi:hypothetical protein AQJ46_28385 [Streptomyces canus]|uniref:Uncharacterized protein n=1 Tax=Streptomyces canus TaxID=58343 RepID=A0A101S083_9ACTN|nr:hypothetical protein AQJ46_28385 [Streptomyces canus]
MYPSSLHTSTAGNQCVPSGIVNLRTRAPVAANTKSLMSIASWRCSVLFCSSVEHHLRSGN